VAAPVFEEIRALDYVVLTVRSFSAAG